ncbi:hypothetical protein D3C76_1216980 [compost metagenome]
MSCIMIAARSSIAEQMAILNLRGKNRNSGLMVDHWRRISASGRGSSNSSAATPAKASVVMLRTQLPEVWMACISTSARCWRMSGTCSSSIQLNWMFCRVVKCP